ncbi:MAG: Queuine tRNA-ribosyltransferase [candidate division WWE3 bacterium GW2011_GWF2_41_45]|uniref:tRNA-guanine(15) transglycosylase-like domain-containing protein n=3 Tax=Katanobacteria TaxID=422282 RepID=A0A1F4W383_UNCKA|nr:MAG: Queuine tRNA-ribosyltransferase [candidate division WWE3 bacterium GW2011_GWC2_41_23]KKS10671.1 MAG: Queuine tRNA-ribosyltransferase [candidate division WWE3 bacterium GW2011_GWF2_41_45]KKS12318.1 MAG: Queuine tRNA-ribosyltransferase [candidate division WWE3 bacterium GW2011_GWF1_41_53]KKS20392.1 MAG: Queuine tRNA-ribosyltransferase [candidate division WWE3 bacterium GW2011_GWE1_41_72]KKS28337.1 MAG: Queuine tRNA-ribosyltransferase [candidate division WWE3 bacterium GW2011_GWC1_42_102]
MGLNTKHGTIKYPAFFPDATHAVIKGISTQDILDSGTTGLVVNTYHAIVDKTVDIIEKCGGLHEFMGFNFPVITDSGGFQAMSLIRRSPGNGKIIRDGIKFKIDGSRKSITLTPENCIQTQAKLGADIMVCLDDCTDPGESQKEQELSVARTVAWAKRCKEEFQKIKKEKPLLFAIIQGGNSKELRKKCAEELIKIGFDGYAYGGWPVDGDGKFLDEIVEYSASLMPDGMPKYAMGIGKPEDIKKCVKMGYNMFDCVLPTRDARHKRLYVLNGSAEKGYEFVYMRAQKHETDSNPVSDSCNCEACKNHSRAYLYHLFKQGDSNAGRLATIHNLTFYSKLMEELHPLTLLR